MGDQMDAREKRRKRRKKNQRIAYFITLLFLVGLFAGAFFGTKYILQRIESSKAEAELTEQMEEETEVIVVPTVEPTVAPVEEVDVIGELADGIIANMTLEEKVANLFMITPEALTGYTQVLASGEQTKEALEEYPVGGLIYFEKNLQTEEQVKEMLSNTIQYSKYIPFIAVDEEGGEVSRIANNDLLATKYDDINVLGDSFTEEDAVQMGETIGTYLSEYGFNLDLAPVGDVLTNADSPLANRIFSSDPVVVSTLTSAFVTGIQGQKISACIKHFPGLGSVEEDSHETKPSTDRTLEEMREEEFLPFLAAIEADVDLIMVGHLATPLITQTEEPASLSKVMITDILRGELGFEGVVITDSMQMEAITDQYTSKEAAVAAILAGADMILMPENFQEAYQGILEAIEDGSLSEERLDESLHRIFSIKYKYTSLSN
jgi:beta-N-acetylhexosaminidase